MKNFKKVGALFLSVLMMGSMFTGCGDGGKNYGNRSKKLEIIVFNGGYGYSWMQDVAEYYMENVNEEVYVDVKQTVLNAEEGVKLTAGLATSDLYFLEYVYNKSTEFVDLTDLLDDYPTGETAHTIREKMGDDLYKTYNKGDYWFQMPYSDNHTYHFIYNKTTLDQTLGAGNYVMPRTTNELFELGDALKKKGCYLFAGAYGDHNDYFHYQFPVWFAQVAGVDGLERFYNGEYFNSESEAWELAESAPLNISEQEVAYKAMYQNLLTLCRSDNGYVHPQSNAMTFVDLESVFYGYGFGINKKKVAFICNGPWVENEIGTLVSVMGDEMDQDIGVMKMPIASEILNRLPSVVGTTEEKEMKLREIISYVDGESQTKPTGVSDEDIATVDEARRFVASITTGSAVIPKNSDAVEEAKDFLRFCASDIAREISAKATKGINMLAYDAFGQVDVSEEVSGFAKSLNKVLENAIYSKHYSENSKFIKVTGFNLLRQSELQFQLTQTAPSKLKSADSFYNEYYNFYNNRWDNIISTYKNVMGNKQ